jgi:hypothetical protein
VKIKTLEALFDSANWKSLDRPVFDGNSVRINTENLPEQFLMGEEMGEERKKENSGPISGDDEDHTFIRRANKYGRVSTKIIAVNGRPIRRRFWSLGKDSSLRGLLHWQKETPCSRLWMLIGECKRDAAGGSGGLFQCCVNGMEERSRTFDAFDKNKDKKLDANELQQLLIKHFPKCTITDAEAQSVLNNFDEDNNRTLDKGEFTQWWDTQTRNFEVDVELRESLDDYMLAKGRLRDAGYFLDLKRCLTPSRFHPRDSYVGTFCRKVKLFGYLSLGLWTREVTDAFQVKTMAHVYDADHQNDQKNHQEVMETIGVSHSLLWQYFTGFTFVAKLSEAMNSPPCFVWDTISSSRKRQNEVEGAQKKQAEATPKVVAIIDAPDAGAAKDVELRKAEHEKKHIPRRSYMPG